MKKEFTYFDVYQTGTEGFEFGMTEQDARMCCHQGSCDDDCEAARGIPYIREQLDALTNKQMEAAVREYGVEFEEYKGRKVPREVLELYVVWLAAGDIMDELYEREKAEAA